MSGGARGNGRSAARWLTAACTLLSCTSNREPATAYRLPARANVIVVALDACRPDKLSAYGFKRDTSPQLSAFARDPDTVLYRRHHVAAAATRSSTASLFTGLPVSRHGVLTVMRRPDRPPAESQVGNAYALDARFTTLAEALRTRGFSTFGVVHTSHIGAEYGFAQGFESYGDPGSDDARVRQFVEQAARAARPFFGYLHVLACHHPFPPAERDAGYMRAYALPYDEEARRAVGVDFTTAAVMWPIRDGVLRLHGDDVRFLHLIYEASLRYADEHTFGALIDGLRRIGAYDDSLIIVTADHGEELYDHGGYAHGHALWEPVIAVPLLVKYPRDTRPTTLGREVDGLTSNIDVMPSILSAIGAPVDADLPGQSLFAPAAGRAIVAETVGVDGITPLWMVAVGEHKLLADGPRRQLFDLARDPLEHEDLAPQHKDEVAALEAAGSRLRASSPASAPTVQVKLPAAVLENLRSLGYGSPDG